MSAKSGYLSEYHRGFPWPRFILMVLGVSLPTFLLMGFLQDQLTLPLLEDDVRKAGISLARRFSKNLRKRNFRTLKEDELNEEILQLVLDYPSVMQVDVFRVRGESTHLLASSIEYEPGSKVSLSHVPREMSYLRKDDEEGPHWEIIVPIINPKRRIHGVLRLLVSMKPVLNVAHTFRKILLLGSFFQLIVLGTLLIFLFRKIFSKELAVKQLEQEKLDLFERLTLIQNRIAESEKLSVISQMAASFAHEVGTPLNAIGMHLQLLGRDLVGKEFKSNDLKRKPNERIRIIRSQVDRIEAIIENFISSSEEPRRPYQLVDLNKVLRDSVALMSPRIDSEAVQVEWDLAPDLPHSRCVQVEIEQILTNIVNNALDGLALDHVKTKKKLSVFSRVEQDEDQKIWAKIEVMDNGIGINKKLLQKIFIPFFTTKTGRGSGLGLAICKELAAKNHGEIKVESSEGEWTKVTLRFPREKFI